MSATQRLEGKFDRKGGTLIKGACSTDLTAVSFYDLLCDR
jgi:hypothetical protein